MPKLAPTTPVESDRERARRQQVEIRTIVPRVLGWANGQHKDGVKLLDAAAGRASYLHVFLVETNPTVIEYGRGADFRRESLAPHRYAVVASCGVVVEREMDEGRYFWETLEPDALAVYYGGRMLDDPGPLQADEVDADRKGNMTAVVYCLQDGHRYRLHVKDYEPGDSESADWPVIAP